MAREEWPHADDWPADYVEGVRWYPPEMVPEPIEIHPLDDDSPPLATDFPYGNPKASLWESIKRFFDAL